MILADKILSLRKSNGWSQEELAEKMNVTRQSISKWESAASIPDINKILELARLFGVTTDYLLIDDLAAPAFTQQDACDVRRVSMEEANDYMDARAAYGKSMALGVMLCILAPVLLLFLGGLSDTGAWGLVVSEAAAAGVGIGVLLAMVAGAVALFIFSSARMERFAYLKKEFELAYGVAGVVRERRAAFSRTNSLVLAGGVALCILSPVPLIAAGASGAEDMVCILFVCLLLCLVSVAVYGFLAVSIKKGAYDQLLGEGEYDREEQKANKQTDLFGSIYWPSVTAVYLLWSFLTGAWHITWLVWAVAGLLFAVISAAIRANRTK